jgi:hypothetical protein
MPDESADQLYRLKEKYRSSAICAFGLSMSGNSPEPPDREAAARGCEQARKELTDFCLATGQDLEELTRFYQYLDAALAGYSGS